MDAIANNRGFKELRTVLKNYLLFIFLRILIVRLKKKTAQ